MAWAQNNPANPSPGSKASKWDGTSHRVNLNKAADYGCPVEGSKTDKRGKLAGARISNEIMELCEIIRSIGQRQSDDTYTVEFGPLFEMYTKISNKLVGILMRARRHKLIQFEGEMLFQRRDDHVVIRLVEMPSEEQ